MKDGMQLREGNLIGTKVKSFKLDEFIKERNLDRVDLMKIDTESTEPEVLQGASSLLQRDRPTLIREVLQGCGSEKPMEEILLPLGYKFYLLTPEGAIQREHIQGHPEFLNYLFITLDSDDIAKLYK